jgi:hypothetical protein
VTTNTLHGLEGLRAALECPEEWEADSPRNSGFWYQFATWRNWGIESIEDENNNFRRIEKPREAMMLERDVQLIYGNPSGARLSVDLPHWSPMALVRVTIREVIPGAPEPLSVMNEVLP